MKTCEIFIFCLIIGRILGSHDNRGLNSHNKRDINSYDVTRLGNMGYALKDTGDALNKTLYEREVDAAKRADLYTSQFFLFGNYSLGKIESYIEKIIHTTKEIIHSLPSIVLVAALIFFSVGAIIFFIMLILYNEYRLWRKKYYVKKNVELNILRAD